MEGVIITYIFVFPLNLIYLHHHLTSWHPRFSLLSAKPFLPSVRVSDSLSSLFSMAAIRLPPEDTDTLQARQPATGDLISDDDQSVAADSWSLKSNYRSILDDDQRHADATEALSVATNRAASDYRLYIYIYIYHQFVLILC